MKGAEADLFGSRASHGGGAFLHFIGGFVGKGDPQDIGRIYLMLFDQIDDTANNDTGFAAARACQYQ